MDAGTGGNVGQDRGPVARPVRVAAGQDLGPGGDRFLDLPGYPVTRGGGDQRPDHRPGGRGVADRQ